MAFKTSACRFEERRLSAEDLRRVYDSALCEIHQADLAAKKKLQRRISTVERAKRLGISQADAEKRALSEAVRALAELWKV
jgi:hypothetical protein